MPHGPSYRASLRLYSDNADADQPTQLGRLHEWGRNRHAHPLDPPGYWARHVGKVIRVIGGDPSWARLATSTSRIGGGPGGSRTGP